MRVALDGIPLNKPRTGVGHYTFELARHLAVSVPTDQFELVSPFEFDSRLDDEALPANLKLIHTPAAGWQRRWFAAGLPLHLRRSAADLFHGTNYEVPLWRTCPTVLTIHDLSLFLYPATHEDRLVRRGRRRLPIMARRANSIVTPSQAVKEEVCQYLKTNPAKVVVIPEAPRSIFSPASEREAHDVARRFQIEDKFILFVGTIEPRKNLITLLEAFEEVLRKTSLRPQLVIAGNEGWLTDDFFYRVRKSAVADRLVFTGYLMDKDLRALYSSCRVFVYPSLYEGFGLPPLEAMACGAPVITSKIPSLMETVGPNAARAVSPQDVQGLARAIVDLLENEDERKYLSRAGSERAKQFSWEKAARSTLDLYHSVLKTNRKPLAMETAS
jgi:glycosyltransferase involved in cell wall biosynthesis